MAKKSGMVAQPYDDNHWEKEEDVRALARAAAIKKDPVRLKAAHSHAKTMKAEHMKRKAESSEICKMADKK
jgi:pyruvate-formate lyase-activating enzyme